MSGQAASPRLESLLRRDRLLVLSGLVGIAALSWIWLVLASRDMYGDMSGLAAWMMVERWTPGYFLLIFAMWVAMMLGMMLPSAAPAILLYGRIVRSPADGDRPALRQYGFAAGYLTMWTAFSLGAAVLQWLLSASTLLNPMMELSAARWAGAFLILAGVYQWTPLKRSCLAHCQSSAIWLSQNWRPGLGGAIRMGGAHGLYCVGCCWALMLLLFVGGVMSLAWIAGLTIGVFVEKLAPPRLRVGEVFGAGLVVAGLVVLI